MGYIETAGIKGDVLGSIPFNNNMGYIETIREELKTIVEFVV